jgi:hypothetical protein
MDNPTQIIAGSNTTFYLTISTMVLGKGCLSKYMEYQDGNALIKDVIARQKIHTAEYCHQNVQNPLSIGKQFLAVPRGYKGQYTGLPQVKTQEEVIAVICLNNNRMLRSNGKVWDQLSSLDTVWLVTDRVLISILYHNV